MDSLARRIEGHYAQPELETLVLEALVAAGKDLDRLSLEDLAPIDQFHIRGRKATLELAGQIHLDDSLQVLDVGSGLGGASRYLAREFGCRVTGLDITREYCQVATMLAGRLGLDTQVRYHHGNALEMSFEDATFDVLWTQHTAMNIPDKVRLYGEMWRVLKPGGVLVSYEVFAGEGGPVHFPVPWAREPSISFLITPEQMRALFDKIGFEILHWQDTTETGRSWFRHMGDKIRKEGPPPLGIHVLLGADFPTMAYNQVRNLEEDRIVLIETIVKRPSSQ